MAKRLWFKDSTEEITNWESSKLLGKESASIAANLAWKEVTPKSKINSKPRIKPTEVKLVEEFLEDSFFKLENDDESLWVCHKICDNNRNLGKYAWLMSTFDTAVKELEEARPDTEWWWDFFEGDDGLPLWFILFVDWVRNRKFTSETDVKTVRAHLINGVVDRLHWL